MFKSGNSKNGTKNKPQSPVKLLKEEKETANDTKTTNIIGNPSKISLKVRENTTGRYSRKSLAISGIMLQNDKL